MKVAVVVPSYNVADSIEKVVANIADRCYMVICVNDCSTDHTAEVLEHVKKSFDNVVVIHREKNGGVGAAMLTGFQQAIDSRVDMIVKMDGDGQMDPAFLPLLVESVANNESDFAKGNRFKDFQALRRMPFIRRAGNLWMSFLIKAASGYWEVFDPANGYFCIRTDFAAQLNKRKIAHRYFFESSLIIELYYLGTRIKDVPMPAIYGDEKSNLSVKKVLWEFPPKLLKAFFRRIILRYYIYDFNIASLHIIFGTIFLLFGVIYGTVNFVVYFTTHVPAPTGTVVLPTLGIVLGVQFLLAAINYDIEKGRIK